MSDLIAKLDKRLTGDNPCAWHKLTPEEWAELRAMLVDEIAFSRVSGAPSCADIGHTLSQ